MSTGAAPVASATLSKELFDELIRCPRDGLDAYLGDICDSTELEGTRASVHCRFLLADGNGRPRFSDLARRVAQELVDYAIPREASARAREKDAKGKTNRHTVALHQKAQALFTQIASTGEGGEMLIYMLIETYLKVPQIICKMPLKTNPDVHYHGADGIHGTYDPVAGKLVLYWAESKLHKSVSKAFSECFESLAPFLTSDAGSDSRQERDLQLLSDNLNLDNPDLEAALLRHLDPDDPMFLQLEYRGACLVGFDSNKYPADANTMVSDEIKAALASLTKNWNKSIGTHLTKHKIATFHLEVFCLPFPSIERFRKAFLKEIGVA